VALFVFLFFSHCETNLTLTSAAFFLLVVSPHRSPSLFFFSILLFFLQVKSDF
jgi:hypothetical protein